MLAVAAGLAAIVAVVTTGATGAARAGPTAGASAPLRAETSGGDVASLTADHQLFLEALPRKGEGLLAFTRRLCGDPEAADLVAAANGGERRLVAGVRYRVPFSLLVSERQLEVLEILFPDDEVHLDGWRHRIRARGAVGESLWSVAEWFTGRGDNYRALRDFNRLADDHLESGQTVVIPARLLRPALRRALPPGSDYYLEYGSDRSGDFAVYRLKAGEALYSSVVVRFTGRVFAEDVNALAAEIAKRSGIRDVTDIPVGYEVKVPFDLLLPEFLPAGDPRRREYEQGLLAASRYSNPIRAERLQGVWIVLDAGHGGADVGASRGGVWESNYVYDIMLRVKLLLESSTAARVLATVRDGAEYRLPDRDVLPYSRAHRVLTDPEYPIEDSTVGLHLRWYLANSVFARARQSGVDPGRVVFVSIHADSLHPSLRGAMAYIPGARYREGSYGKSGSVYAARREVREKPRVSFSREERERSEGLSRELARRILESFHRRELTVHADKPIREKVIRSRRAWVPAVLRYNAVPAQLLLEVCNMANEQDFKLLQTQKFRQQVAEAVVEGIVDYYGDGAGPAGPRVAGLAR